MSTTVSLGLVLPDEYTPLTTFNTGMTTVDDRLASVEAWQADFDTTRVAALETKVADLETRLQALEGTAATAADLDAVTARVTTAEATLATTVTQVDEVVARVGSFSFATGDVAALQAVSPLSDDQLYVVVDTATNLQTLADGAADDTLYSTVVFGHATATS